MASLKQLRANQANAQLATGPKTLTGKHKASQNAVRHRLSVPLADAVMAPLQAKVASALIASSLATGSADALAEKIIEFERNMALFRQVEGQKLAGQPATHYPVTPIPEVYLTNAFLVKNHAKRKLQQEHIARIDFDRYLRRARNQLIKGLREATFLQNEPNHDALTSGAFDA